MKHLQHMREIAPAFDGFIVDLWGVIHDGVHALPGAIECLASLRENGKRIVLLSNAPRRARLVVEQLRGLGVTDRLYDRVVTSGEVTRDMLIDRNDDFLRPLGRRLYHLGPPRDRNVLEDVDAEVVADLAAADLLLNTGPDDLRPADVDHYRPVLEQAAARDLPMLCANPDLVIVRGGQQIICAGLLAEHYRQMGGRVRLVGKPDPAVYAPVIETLGMPPSRICAVGDSLATDIRGATNASVASVWILGGIHSHLLGDPEEAVREAGRAGLAPVAALPAFVW